MTLCCKVVYLVGTYLGHDLHDRHRIAQIGVMQMEMLATFEMRYTLAEIHRRTADGAVYVVTLIQ